MLRAVDLAADLDLCEWRLEGVTLPSWLRDSDFFTHFNGLFSFSLWLIFLPVVDNFDLDFERVMDRLEAERRDLSGVITGLCLLKLPRHRPLDEDLSLVAELKEPY